MLTFYIDESGYTGTDFLCRDQPIFVLATNNYDDDEANEILMDQFNIEKYNELKYTKLKRNQRHINKIVEIIRTLAQCQTRSGIWIAHKEFALVAFVVEFWIEPYAKYNGMNLYKNGENHGLTNFLFMFLEYFWDRSFRYKLLSYFQDMFKTKTLDSYLKCRNFLEMTYRQSVGEQNEVIEFLLRPFVLLDYDYIKNLGDLLDLGVHGLIRIGHKWRSQNGGPFHVYHDRSSSMAKQKGIWDAISSCHLDQATFPGPGNGTHVFPMNVKTTEFGDSVSKKQIQICDILAGAAFDYYGYSDDKIIDKTYHDRLTESGIGNLVWGVLWPSTNVTPDELGKRGWDLSVEIDWINGQLQKRGP
ncbi:MAG: DUF3800 domain-containing protein [Magnetococcus sp. DMHC-1]